MKHNVSSQRMAAATLRQRELQWQALRAVHEAAHIIDELTHRTKVGDSSLAEEAYAWMMEMDFYAWMQQQASYKAYKDKNLEEMLAKIKAGTPLLDALREKYKYKADRTPDTPPVRKK
jgi:hypothetical protein